MCFTHVFVSDGGATRSYEPPCPLRNWSQMQIWKEVLVHSQLVHSEDRGYLTFDYLGRCEHLASEASYSRTAPRRTAYAIFVRLDRPSFEEPLSRPARAETP